MPACCPGDEAEMAKDQKCIFHSDILRIMLIIKGKYSSLLKEEPEFKQYTQRTLGPESHPATYNHPLNTCIQIKSIVRTLSFWRLIFYSSENYDTAPFSRHFPAHESAKCFYFSNAHFPLCINVTIHPDLRFLFHSDWEADTEHLNSLR